MTTAKRIALTIALCAGLLPLAASAQTQPTASRHIFVTADLNKDGVVDLDEYHKDIVRAFHSLDHNRDGYITVDEVHSIPDRRRAQFVGARMMKLDRDGDGKLSFKEVVEARMGFFDETDANKNERLSLDEVLAFDAKRALQVNAGAAATKP